MKRSSTKPRDCRSGKHYLGNWVCHGVLRASCFLWDREDEEFSHGVRAEHLSQGQSPSISNRAGEGTAEVALSLGIRHLHGDGNGDGDEASLRH